MNKSSSSRRWILAAAVAAALPLAVVATTASAQQRINTNGRALDANNRVGSGGQNPNDNTSRGVENQLGNDIVTGNVTGGKQFRGPIDYTDPRAFRGQTAGVNMDNFIRQSSGPTKDSRLAEETVPFYGQGRGVAPPPNFVQSGLGTGAYVPIPAGTVQNRPIGDQRVGAVDFSQPYVLPAPGQLLLPGPVDPSAGQQFITASPLTGIRQINANDPNFFNNVSNTQYNPATGRLDDNAIQKMRDELNAAAGASDPGAIRTGEQINNSNNGTNGTNGNDIDPATGAPRMSPPGPGATRIEQQPLILPGSGTGAVPVDQKPLNDAISRDPNNLATGQSVRNRMTNLVKPEEQSTVYAQLRRKHDEAAADQSLNDTEAARAYNAARHAEAEAKNKAAASGAPAGAGAAPGQPGAAPAGVPGAPGVPGQPGAGQLAQPSAVAGAPGAAPIPQPPGPGDAPAPGVTDYAARNTKLLKEGTEDANRNKPKRKVYAPVKVPSLATGVKGKGLSDVLKNAENLMKEGKFTSALDQYDAAEQVAPNNPLTRLGRANAELGAAYYARAEAHLRDVFQKNPELLAGQYDLTNMLGEQRMQVLVKDLKEIANREQKEARPVFLLAYIAYNTGSEQNAEAYLDLADKRSGGKDPFFQLLRDNWALPAGGAPTTAPAPAAAPDGANK